MSFNLLCVCVCDSCSAACLYELGVLFPCVDAVFGFCRLGLGCSTNILPVKVVCTSCFILPVLGASVKLVVSQGFEFVCGHWVSRGVFCVVKHALNLLIKSLDVLFSSPNASAFQVLAAGGVC